ncbi:MAG TPA: DUF2062 domain-containing protein [Victivallales bacterium]|nr:DUF2062 domain-containing protein [Victivallales bacterium]
MLKKTRKLIKFFYFKLLRSKETPHSIALAIAFGVFVGCFVPPGGHTVIVLLLAFIFKTDKILAFAATWIANPYTVPFLYPTFCFIGSKIIGAGLSFKEIEKILLQAIHSFSLTNFEIIGEKLAISFLIGGFIFGVVFGLSSYFITYFLVISYRKRRAERMKNKILVDNK